MRFVVVTSDGQCSTPTFYCCNSSVGRPKGFIESERGHCGWRHSLVVTATTAAWAAARQYSDILEASVVMQRPSYLTETVLSIKITRDRTVLSFKDSPRKPLGLRPCVCFAHHQDPRRLCRDIGGAQPAHAIQHPPPPTRSRRFVGEGLNNRRFHGAVHLEFDRSVQLR